MAAKPLHIAIQMDPLAGIAIGGDSTFLLGLGAQARGHALFYYEPQNLSWQGGQLFAHGHAVTLRAEAGNHFTLGPAKTIALDEAADVILLRQDPPFDMGYVTNTYLLELAAQKKPIKIINDPIGVRNAPEKLLITHFPHLIPPTLVSSRAEELADFAAAHGTVVAKKLHGNAGRDVFRFTDAASLQNFAAAHFDTAREPIMLQAFLPDVQEGDKRIILFGGEVAGAIRRVPAKGDFRANLAQGAKAEVTELTDEEINICASISPYLKAMGLFFVGLDTIGGKLIEINVTSPTGLASINALYGLEGEARMEQIFWKLIEDEL